MRMRMGRTLSTSLCLAALLLSVACGDDDNDPKGEVDSGTQDDAGQSEVDAGETNEDAGNDAGVTENEPVYVIASQILGMDTSTSTIIRHEGDLFAGAVNTQGAEQVGGRALVQSGLAAGSVYVASNEGAVVTRYDDKNGKLSKGEGANLAVQGVQKIEEYAGQLVMVSETKALYFDGGTLKVVVWNPENMTVTKAIDISSLKVANFAATFSTLTVQKGDFVYMPVGYRTPNSVASKAAVVVVDTKNDTATVITDDRCGYVRDAVDGEDGKLYLATEAFGSSVHHLSSSAGPKPCLLRVDYASNTFDASFHVDLNELAGGATVGSLIKLPNGKFYTRALDVSKAGISASTVPRALASALAWDFREITLGDQPTVGAPIAGAPVIGGSFVPMPVGDKLLVPDYAPDRSKTTLCDMTDGPSCERKVELPGLVFSVALVE